MNYTNDSDVRFYTNMGFYVGVYNYRGAGESTGVVTPNNTVSDALHVVALMKSHYRATLSVVHGISIGGYVVQGCTTHSPFVVYDRNFRDMDSLVAHFVRGRFITLSCTASFLAFLVRLCRGWPMPVASRVDIKKPSLLIFDPDDEIAVFPASLLMGLTDRFYRRDETTEKLEELMDKEYGEFQQALAKLLEELQTSLEYVDQKWGGASGKNVMESGELTDRMKILLLTLHTEILGIPFINAVREDYMNGNTEKWNELKRIMTVWRQRVENVDSSAFSVDKTVEVLETFPEKDEVIDRLTGVVRAWELGEA